jgi:hypothetical protein
LPKRTAISSSEPLVLGAALPHEALAPTAKVSIVRPVAGSDASTVGRVWPLTVAFDTPSERNATTVFDDVTLVSSVFSASSAAV